MSLEENKAIARRIPLEVFNQGRVDVIDEVVDPGYVEHTELPGFPSGIEGFRALVPALRTAFPDYTYTILQEVAEGDIVIEYLSATATMQGDFLGMKANGKTATWTEAHIARMGGGKVQEHWGVLDLLTMLQQLGFAPMPGAAPV